MRAIKFYRVFLLLLVFLILNIKSSHIANAQSFFLENKGRFPSFVNYSKQTGSGMFYYNNNGYTLLLRNTKQYDSLWEHIHHYKTIKSNFTVDWHRIDMKFKNSNPSIIEPEFKVITKYNFHKGNNPNKWSSNIAAFQRITYKNLYSGIDWQIDDLGKGVKHNFIVQAKSDPNQIIMQYYFADGIEIIDGNLHIKSSVGYVYEQKPYAFQIVGLDTQNIACSYTLKKSGDLYELGFELGEYDKNRELVIDPILVFSTYSGSLGDNFGFTATYDSKSHLYAGGIVDGGTGTNGGPFPVTVGAFQTVYSGGTGQAPANLPCDIGINKYDSAGSILLYSTYLGGSRDEYPHSLVADQNDNILVMGTTYSPDFPIDTGGYDISFNGGTDLFVVKLSEDGSDMLGGTYIGGSGNDGLNTLTLRYNYADDFRGDIVVDTADNVYVASTTNSNNFPMLKAIQNTLASAQDGCVFSFDRNLRKLRFSTYLGGNKDDAMYSIRLYDTFVYVGGGTASDAMSFAVNGNKVTYTGGRADGFIAKLTINGLLTSSSYFGTNTYDQIYFLDIDASGQVYASGQTDGNIPRTPGTYGKDRTSQFIVRFSPNINVITLSTTFGNRTFNPEISPSAFLVDKCNNIYFSGWGSPIDYDGLHSLTTKDLQITSDAIQKITDEKDFYILVLSKDASKLLFATYYGGDETDDHVDGGTSRFDKRGVVYQSVCASCPEPGNQYSDFPVSSNARFKTNLSPRCSNASFKIDFQINFQVDAKFTATPKDGCEPLLVVFKNESKYARQYIWDFGDGSPIDTSKNPTHIFQNPGVYKVKLTSIDSFSCNIAEFDSTIITVKEMPLANFEYTSEICSREFSFKNKSENFISPEWDFGDSSGINQDNDPKHRFLTDGIFNVLLTVKHPSSGCIDTQTTKISMFSNPLLTLQIPNVFTPNSDNKNDCYTIGGIMPGCDEAEIWIYNRWGILVFNGILPYDCWNGYYQNDGGLLPDGTYYYILKIKSKNPDLDTKEKIEGVIRIIR